MGKLTYLANSLLHRLSKNSCPSCGSRNAHIVDKKIFGVTILLQCQNCFLPYRFPSDSLARNYSFYQHSYAEPRALQQNCHAKQIFPSLSAQASSIAVKTFRPTRPLSKPYLNILGAGFVFSITEQTGAMPAFSLVELSALKKPGAISSPKREEAMVRRSYQSITSAVHSS